MEKTYIHSVSYQNNIVYIRHVYRKNDIYYVKYHHQNVRYIRLLSNILLI
jgi:hypothetical protein